MASLIYVGGERKGSVGKQTSAMLMTHTFAVTLPKSPELHNSVPISNRSEWDISSVTSAAGRLANRHRVKVVHTTLIMQLTFQWHYAQKTDTTQLVSGGLSKNYNTNETPSALSINIFPLSCSIWNCVWFPYSTSQTHVTIDTENRRHHNPMLFLLFWVFSWEMSGWIKSSLAVPQCPPVGGGSSPGLKFSSSLLFHWQKYPVCSWPQTSCLSPSLCYYQEVEHLPHGVYLDEGDFYSRRNCMELAGLTWIWCFSCLSFQPVLWGPCYDTFCISPG